MLRATILSVACVFVLSLCTTASGVMVVFDNASGEFVWNRAWDGAPPPEPNYLDPMLPPSQSGAATGRAIRLWYYGPDSSTEIVALPFGVEADIRIATDEPYIFEPDPFLQPKEIEPAHVFDPGQLVGAGGETWSDRAHFLWQTVSGFNPLLGEDAYIGVRVMIDSQPHYGWIHLIWDEVQDNTPGYAPVAWAYETEAGVPILVPEPGSVGLVVLVCAGLIARRRA